MPMFARAARSVMEKSSQGAARKGSMTSLGPGSGLVQHQVPVQRGKLGEVHAEDLVDQGFLIGRAQFPGVREEMVLFEPGRGFACLLQFGVVRHKV